MNKDYEVYVEIENKCLMNCKHCSSNEMRQLESREFTDIDLINVIRLIEGNIHLYMTGGEPLLNDNLLEIITTIKEDSPNINIGLFSCGIVNTFNEIDSIDLVTARKLKDKGVHDCYLSIYHIDELKHDYITNNSSSHKKTLQTISNLLEVQIEVKIHLVVNRLNINNLEDIIKQITQIGVNEIRILRLVHGGSAVINWEDIGVPYEIQNKAIFDIINKIDSFETRITISGFPEHYPCRPNKNSVKCQAGANVLYITYQGEVYPCACTKNQKSYLIGNINEIEKIQAYLDSMKTVAYHDHCLNPIEN